MWRNAKTRGSQSEFNFFHVSCLNESRPFKWCFFVCVTLSVECIMYLCFNILIIIIFLIRSCCKPQVQSSSFVNRKNRRLWLTKVHEWCSAFPKQPPLRCSWARHSTLRALEENLGALVRMDHFAGLWSAEVAVRLAQTRPRLIWALSHNLFNRKPNFSHIKMIKHTHCQTEASWAGRIWTRRGRVVRTGEELEGCLMG